MFNMMFTHKMKSQIIEPVVSSPLILKGEYIIQIYI